MSDLIARTVRGEGFLNGGFEFVWIGDRKLTAKQVCEAAERIERLEAMLGEAREAINDGVGTLAAVRATASTDEWPEAGEHFSGLCFDTIKRMNAVLAKLESEHE